MIKKIFIIPLLVALCLGGFFAYANAEEEAGESGAAAAVEEIAAPAEEAAPSAEVVTGFEKAKVISIDKKSEVIETETGERVETFQEIGIVMLEGSRKGEDVFFKDSPNTNPLSLKFEIGQKLLMYVEDAGGENWSVYIDSIYRVPALIWLVIIFCAFLLLLGGIRKGFQTILSLLISIVLIFVILVPAILAGYNAVLITFALAAVIATVTLLLVGGRNKKSLAAIFGTLGGVVVAFILSYIFANLAYLTGLSTEEGRLLAATIEGVDPKGVFLAGILIGALGASMDVAISVAASVNEVKQASAESGFKKLFSSGMNVGRDVIGTMSNTLIFAYVGAALPMLILFHQLGESWFKFINFNFIADEIVRSIGGSIGMIAVIPITALIAAYFFKAGEAKSRLIAKRIDKKN